MKNAAMPFEPPNRAPKYISPQAHMIASVIDREVSNVLALHGVVRDISPESSRLPGIIAQMVQLAINETLDQMMNRSDA